MNENQKGCGYACPACGRDYKSGKTLFEEFEQYLRENQQDLPPEYADFVEDFFEDILA